MTTEEAVNHLREQLKTSKGLYTAWQSNIAMSFYDAVLKTDEGKSIDKSFLHKVANNGADSFIKSLIEQA